METEQELYFNTGYNAGYKMALEEIREILMSTGSKTAALVKIDRRLKELQEGKDE